MLPGISLPDSYLVLPVMLQSRAGFPRRFFSFLFACPLGALLDIVGLFDEVGPGKYKACGGAGSSACFDGETWLFDLRDGHRF